MPLDKQRLSEVHIQVTYDLQRGVTRSEVDSADLLELIDVYQLLKGQSAFEAFKVAVNRARKAEQALADMRMACGARCLLKAVEIGDSGSPAK